MTHAADIRILSADAPKTGLRKCMEIFGHRSGKRISLELMTAPKIKVAVQAGDVSPDIVVVPLAAMREMAEAGLVRADSIVPIGSVTVGVVVRDGAREPDLCSVEAFRRSLLEADLIVYNLASSGVYFASVLDRLGLKESLAAKTVIVPTGSAVMERLAAEKTADAIGFGHVTEIRLHDDLGTHLVGPLPGEIGRETPYAAGVLTTAKNSELAQNLSAFLGSSEGKRHFTIAGVV